MIIHDSTGINGGMDLREGLDASGRKAKVCVQQFCHFIYVLFLDKFF